MGTVGIARMWEGSTYSKSFFQLSFSENTKSMKTQTKNLEVRQITGRQKIDVW